MLFFITKVLLTKFIAYTTATNIQLNKGSRHNILKKSILSIKTCKAIQVGPVMFCSTQLWSLFVLVLLFWLKVTFKIVVPSAQKERIHRRYTKYHFKQMKWIWKNKTNKRSSPKELNLRPSKPPISEKTSIQLWPNPLSNKALNITASDLSYQPCNVFCNILHWIQ